MEKNLKDLDFALLKLLNDLKEALLATWRNGYAEDCKSFYPSSILGVASIKITDTASKEYFKSFYLSSIMNMASKPYFIVRFRVYL